MDSFESWTVTIMTGTDIMCQLSWLSSSGPAAISCISCHAISCLSCHDCHHLDLQLYHVSAVTIWTCSYIMRQLSRLSSSGPAAISCVTCHNCHHLDLQLYHAGPAAISCISCHDCHHQDLQLYHASAVTTVIIWTCSYIMHQLSRLSSSAPAAISCISCHVTVIICTCSYIMHKLSCDCHHLHLQLHPGSHFTTSIPRFTKSWLKWAYPNKQHWI